MGPSWIASSVFVAAAVFQLLLGSLSFPVSSTRLRSTWIMGRPFPRPLRLRLLDDRLDLGRGLAHFFVERLRQREIAHRSRQRAELVGVGLAAVVRVDGDELLVATLNTFGVGVPHG